MKVSKCEFCGKIPAMYARRKDGTNRKSPYYPACEKCARRPYPERGK